MRSEAIIDQASMIDLAYDHSPNGEPLRRISDGATIGTRFNVMPGRAVEETFFVREYRIWHRYIEAEIDRTYLSSDASITS